MASGAKKVFVTRLTDTFTDDREGVGVLRWEGNKCYKWVQYTVGVGSVAAAAGKVAYLRSDGKVTSDLSDSLSIGAGVLQSAPADNEYCWVQVKGEATLALAFTAGVNGNAVTPVGATDGTLDVSALVTDPICGVILNATAKTLLCDFPY